MLIYMVKRIQKESNLQLFILYMDKGTEFRNELVENFCFSTGIEPRYTPTNTPQLNGLAERSYRTLLVKVRILLEQARLSHLYWPQAANFATVLLNRTPSKTQLKSPYEVIFKVKPTLENIFIFGQRVVYIDPEVKSKVHTPGRKAKYLGPAKHSAESYLLDDTPKNIVTTRNFKDLNNIDLLRNRKKRGNPLRDVRIERNLESMEKELSAREQFLNIRNEATVEKPRHWVRRTYDLKQTTTTEKFVGYEIEKVRDGTHISLKEYIEELNKNYEAENIAQKINTPYIPNEYLYKEEDGVLDPALYQSIIGSLTYVSETIRPDIAFAVNRLAVFGNCPTKKHLNAAKRVLRYLSQTKDLGTTIKSFGKKLCIEVFSDASWGNVPDGTSKDGYIILINSIPISWKSRKQKKVAKSTTEAETIALARALSTLVWITTLIKFLKMKEPEVKMYCDSLSTIKLLDGQSLSFRSRHMKIKYFFVRNIIKENEWEVQHIRSRKNIADMMTKPGSVRGFLDARRGLLRRREE
eukprot:maker-scaffold_9-augustus-gene-2.0-mRNA-1 protein AED:0.20 eAED:0.20 QI:0/0/0/1/0/0.5/2/0/523